MALVHHEPRALIRVLPLAAVFRHLLRPYRYGASPLVRGGFNWALTFKWKSISRTEIRNKQSDPVLSPTMAGGLFAIHRKWFIELGTYDLVRSNSYEAALNAADWSLALLVPP